MEYFSTIQNKWEALGAPWGKGQGDGDYIALRNAWRYAKVMVENMMGEVEDFATQEKVWERKNYMDRSHWCWSNSMALEVGKKEMAKHKALGGDGGGLANEDIFISD